MQDFGTTNETLGTLMTTIYLLGYAFGPLVIAPLSEMYGRAILYRCCTFLFAVFNVACAVANSFGSLVAYRLLAGIAGSCAGTLGASSIADMVVREKRGAAMAAYIMGPVLGPTIGPIIGSNLMAAAGWRWNFWLMAIASGVMAVLVVVFLHESYPYVILKRKTARLRRETGSQSLRSALDTSKTPRQLFAFSILRPLKMLVSPIIFLMSAYAATVFSYAYLCFTTFPRIFKDQYGFGSRASGLTSIGLGVGFVLGLLFCGAVSDRWSAYLTKKNDGMAKPEYRLPTLVSGAVFVPIGLFWYGWTAEYQTHWIVPIIGTAMTGIGIVTAYVSAQRCCLGTAFSCCSQGKLTNTASSLLDDQRYVSHRRVHRLRGVGDSGECHPALSLRRSAASGRQRHVQHPGRGVGQFAPWLHLVGLSSPALHLVLLRSKDP